MIGLGAQKIRVVGQHIAGLARKAEVDRRIGVALIQQIGVPQGQIRSRRSLAAVFVRVPGYSGISHRCAQGGQLLGHGPQFG